MAVDEILTHVADALDRQPEASKGLPNNELVLTAIATQVQALETAFYDLYTLRRLGDATGEQLDLLGRVVQQPRNGQSDVDYERYIRARIAANNSEGLVSDFNRVARGVLNDATLAITYTYDYPAGLVMQVVNAETDATVASILIGFLRDTAAGGVRVQFHFLTDTVANSHTWADAANHPVSSTLQGWGDVAAPGTGGYWSSVIE